MLGTLYHDLAHFSNAFPTKIDKEVFRLQQSWTTCMIHPTNRISEAPIVSLLR